MNVFVPGGSRGVPDEEGGLPYRPGELASFYADWEILDSRRIVFPCRYRKSRPHGHRLESLGARKPRRSAHLSGSPRAYRSWSE